MARDATDEPRQALTVPEPPGRMPRATSGWLNTARPTRREAHVARQRQLAAAAADATLDDLAMVALGIVRNRSHIAMERVQLGRRVGRPSTGNLQDQRRRRSGR